MNDSKVTRIVVASECNCGNCDQCPTLYELSNGDFLMQGYVQDAASAGVELPEGESVVRLPKSFVEKIAKSLKSEI